MGAPRAARVRLALVAVVLLGALLWPLLGGGPGADEVESVVDDSGLLGPVVFVALYAALTVLLVPGVVLTLAAGALFGPWIGTLLTVLGATAGASAAFAIARRLGRDPLGAVSGQRVARLNSWLAERGFRAVLYARLVPIVPFSALNYAAGLTDLRPRDYVAATAIGIVPGAFAYAALGGSLGDPRSTAFLGAVALVALLTGIGTVAARRHRRRTGEPVTGA